MPKFTESLVAIAAAASALPRDSTTLGALSEDELLAIPALLAAITLHLEPSAAAVAGEIARRSTREHGFSALAQRSGFRTTEKLLQHLTGSSSRAASQLVRAGAIIHESELVAASEKTGEVLSGVTEPWLAAVGRAVAAGAMSIEAANAIRRGLGMTTDDIGADALAGAATRLVDDARTMDADQLLARARELRDEIDEAGIADRERALHTARSFRRYRRSDGMTAYSLLADPENAAYLDGIYDCLTSPRRGGPRMVDLADKTRADALQTDPRTLEQLAFDGFMAVLHIGASTDEKTAAHSVLGSRRPAVRVLVTKEALEHRGQRDSSTPHSPSAQRPGHGRIEGQPSPVSIETVERTLCTTGVVPIMFDSDGQCIDLGREQRLYTARQRIGLAARDGGCRWPDCDRPPSWSEAHHINHWARDGGKTDVADGILLCRYHHLLLHDNHWDITRTGSQYWLLPPAREDPHRTPRPMPHKSAALRDLQQAQQAQLVRTG
ncbi:MAG: DUF222 domain-containing protein [Microbacteriaceae bacterium]